MVTGLYGCSCHPFDSWEEHDSFHKQKIKFGKKYRIRHSNEKCIALKIEKGQSGYVNIYVAPYDCNRCNQKEHKSNLILIETDIQALVQMSLF